MDKKIIKTALLTLAAVLLCSCAGDPDAQQVMAEDTGQPDTGQTDTVASQTGESGIPVEITGMRTTADTAVTELPADTETTAETTTTVTYTYESVTLPDVTIEPAEAPAQKVVYDYDGLEPSQEYEEFWSKCVFVGDSICRGFEAYDIIPADRVLAKGNTATWNILDYTFGKGEFSGNIIDCLKDLDPEYIVFSMGMNDVNMLDSQKFCENYAHLLALTENALPDAKLIVCSVTPIMTDSTFTSNSKIDARNATLKKYLDATEKWTFADISHGLKDSQNGLKEHYTGGDGIHLNGYAYKAILYQLAERVLDNTLYDPDGNIIYPDTDETAEETSVPAQMPIISQIPETSEIPETAEPFEIPDETQPTETPEISSDTSELPTESVPESDADTTGETEGSE